MLKGDLPYSMSGDESRLKERVIAMMEKEKIFPIPEEKSIVYPINSDGTIRIEGDRVEVSNVGPEIFNILYLIRRDLG